MNRDCSTCQHWDPSTLIYAGSSGYTCRCAATDIGLPPDGAGEHITGPDGEYERVPGKKVFRLRKCRLWLSNAEYEQIKLF